MPPSNNDAMMRLVGERTVTRAPAISKRPRAPNHEASAPPAAATSAISRIVSTPSLTAGLFEPMRGARSRYHGGMPHKLLLADDSVTIQRVIELTFADEDVEVIAVGNGQDAIERVQRDQPDIVLADIGMPERNGYEVAAFVKGNPATAHIPVVLLTGAFEPIDEGRARTVGCDGVLVKPFEPQVVISRVKDLLAGKKPSGMWSASPVAQGPSRPASADLEMRAGGGPATASADPLEAYFDRLDAAFASTATNAAPDPFAAAPPAAPAGSADPFAGAGAAPKRETIPL